MSNVTLHRTVHANHSETVVGDSRFSTDKIDGTYYVARDGELFGTFSNYADVLDSINTTVINEQLARQDKVIETGQHVCYDLSCLFAQGPVCTCGCLGAGHGLGFTEIKF